MTQSLGDNMYNALDLQHWTHSVSEQDTNRRSDQGDDHTAKVRSMPPSSMHKRAERVVVHKILLDTIQPPER